MKASSSGLSSDLAGGSDTIVARATPAGRGALALIRVSGPAAATCAERVCGRAVFGQGWKASLTELRDAEGGFLDRGIVVAFPGPRSYTGEDMLEVAVHGSPFLVQAVVESFVAVGARAAEPGEFTRRAVANGKLDLVQAEAVRDMVDAETAWQLRNAREQLSGALSDRFKELRSLLVNALARTEAAIDYEAQGVEVRRAELSESLEGCRRGIQSLLATAAAGVRIRDGLRLTIVGPPNSGKSTLFNYLCGIERAIVSPHPGTTRDVLEAQLDMGGVRVILQDTAGLRPTGDEVEIEGQRRAHAALASSDAVVLLWAMDGGGDPPADFVAQDVPVIRVRSKSDLRPAKSAEAGWLRVSCQSGEGVEALRHEVIRRVRADIADLGGAVAIAERHRGALEAAEKELDGCDLNLPETVAESLRWALRSVDILVGEIENADVLDQVFSSFCIGK